MNNRTAILALTGAITCASTALAGGDIVVAAPETEAFVTPRRANVRLVNLPPLDFALRAAIRCKGEPLSLTLSIADSFTTLDGELLAGQRTAETTLTVPASQLALAANGRFCISDEPASADELLVPGLATVHASLRCQHNERASVHFASAPLSVRLRCVREKAVSQEPESASAER